MASLTRCPVTGKLQYRHPDQAIRSALRSSRRRGVALRVYRCPDCNHHHLTKSRKFDIRKEAS